MDFETWWNETGSGILPLPGADMEEHGKLVAGEAWDAAIRARSGDGRASRLYRAITLSITGPLQRVRVDAPVGRGR